ncbi:related to HNM1-Choline permease [Fusarium fujikuroi]|nr:related to HNM1-Choline permease [Fusarium fujikuroi]
MPYSNECMSPDKKTTCSDSQMPDTAVSIFAASCHEQNQEQLRRNIKSLEILSLGFNICNSWIAISTALAIAISAGGTVTVLYGIIVTFVTYLAVAVTLAELASVYPTAGGQYHFTSILCPPKLNRLVSYLLLAVPAFYIKSYSPVSWHYALVFQAINLALLLYNIFALAKARWTHNIGFILSLLMFLVILVVCLALSTKSSSKAVWTTFDNATGWPAGVTFLTGLVTPASMYGGLDGVLHLAEECSRPHRVIPRALMSVIGIGFITGFSFAIAMCYGITDIQPLIGATMPIYDLWRQATRSDVAATVFVVMLHIITLFAVIAVQQTASRMTWAFARDGGLPAKSWLASINVKHQVPLWSLLLNALVISVTGWIYLGSVAAFSAIIGSSLILQLFSFIIPAVLLLWHKRSESVLPRDREFRVPEIVGWSANGLTIILGTVLAVFFTFPGAIPVTGSTMNYASAVIVVIGIVAAVNWFLFARHHFAGPKVEEYLRK